MLEESLSFNNKKIIEYYRRSEDFEYCKIFDDNEELSHVQFYDNANSFNKVYEWKIIKGGKNEGND